MGQLTGNYTFFYGIGMLITT